MKTGEPLPRNRKPVYVVRSLDDGKTWEEPRLVQDGYCGALRKIIQLRSGRIILGSQEAMPNPGRHVTFTFASDDDGVTWRKSNIIDLGRSGGYGDHGGGIEATIAQLGDGRVWMLMRNPQARRPFPPAAGRIRLHAVTPEGPLSSRHVLGIAITPDGQSFGELAEASMDLPAE